MNFLPFFASSGAVDCYVSYLFFASYFIGALGYSWCCFSVCCGWIAWALLSCSLASIYGLFFFCSPCIIWWQCIICHHILVLLCNYLQFFFWGGAHVLRRHTWLQNHQQQVWSALVTNHVSKDLAVTWFDNTPAYWVSFQVACWRGVLIVAIRTYRDLWQYRLTHLHLLCSWVCIMWWFIWVCLWCWYGCTQVLWVVLLENNLRFPLSWTSRLFLISYCWIKYFLPTYLLWDMLPLRDSLCDHRQPQNAFCSSRISRFSRCIQMIFTWRLIICRLARPSSWWTWLCWLGLWCILRRRWIGVQIHLQMKFSNTSCTWVISSVACSWVDCLFPHPLLPWLGGLHFIIRSPFLPVVVVASRWVSTWPLLQVLSAPCCVWMLWVALVARFVRSPLFWWIVALSLFLCVTVCCALARLRSLSVWMLLVFVFVVWLSLLLDCYVKVLSAAIGAAGLPLETLVWAPSERVALLASWILFGSGCCCHW